MGTRRIVGIDLGIASTHTVVVIDETTEVLARRRCRPTAESLATIEAAALAGAPEETRLEVIIEPTGAAWLPVAVFFIRRGHVVHRVSSAKAAALRRFLSQHAKANSIDAEALARLAIVDPDGLQRLQLAEGPAASLDRRVRAADRLTETATRHKVRLRELARQTMPMLDEAITGELTAADVAVLERFGDPRALLRIGLVRLTALIRKASRGHHGTERAEAWRAVARAALDLYGEDPAVPFEDLAAEMATEARLLRAVLTERDGHARQREISYRQADPAGLARSLPGVADIGGPVLVAAMGNPHRFPDAAAFKRFTGLTPRASETGDTDRKGHVQGRTPTPARPARPVSQQRQAPRPPTRRGLLHPDGRTRRPPPKGRLRGRRPPRRTGLGGDVPGRALRRPRRRRHPRLPGPGPGHHRGALPRPRGRPAPPPVTKARGEGPSPSAQGTCIKSDTSPRRQTRRPSPPPHQSRRGTPNQAPGNHPDREQLPSLDNQSRIGSQTCR
jgi:transposase